VNPSTVFQTNARALLTTLSAQWRSLTGVARDSWAAAAAEIIRTDSLGQSYSPTGQQWFIGVNSNNARMGLPASLTPPMTATPTTPTITAFAISQVGMSVTPSAGSAGVFAQVWASPPLSPGVSFNKDFRLMRTVPHVAAAPIVFTADYQNRFGNPPVGMQVIYRVNFLTLGQAGGSTEVAGLATV